MSTQFILLLYIIPIFEVKALLYLAAQAYNC